MSALFGRSEGPSALMMRDALEKMEGEFMPRWQITNEARRQTVLDGLDWLCRLLAAAAGCIRGNAKGSSVEREILNAIREAVPGMAEALREAEQELAADRPVPGPTPNVPSEVQG